MATKNPGLWTLSFGEIVETLKSLEGNGVTPDHLARLRSDKAFAKSVGAFIVNSSGEVAPAPTLEPTLTQFTYMADLDADVETLKKAGNYTYADSYVSTQNFPITKRGKQEVTATLVHFNKDMDSEAVIAWLDANGLRAGDNQELLNFGIKHPEEQRKYPIVQLGSVSSAGYVSYLNGRDGNRSLDCHGFRNGWHARCRFLAFPK